MTPGLKAWKTRLFLALVLLVPAKIGFDISRVPDYTGSDVEVSLSPDGKYKAMDMQIPNYWENFWTSFALGFGNYDNRVLFAIADASTGEMLAFYHPPNNWRSSGSGGRWTCDEENKTRCIGFRFPYTDQITLPPSWWQRTHAKLTVKIKGLENPEFKDVTVYE